MRENWQIFDGRQSVGGEHVGLFEGETEKITRHGEADHLTAPVGQQF